MTQTCPTTPYSDKQNPLSEKANPFTKKGNKLTEITGKFSAIGSKLIDKYFCPVGFLQTSGGVYLNLGSGGRIIIS